MTSDQHHLAGAYALDALDPDERADFEAHLRTCDTCRTDVDTFRETAGRLAGAATATPPSALRDRVLDEIGRTRQASPETTVDAFAERHRRRPPTLTLLASAAALVVLAIGGVLLFGLRDSSSGVDDTIAATDAIVTPLTRTPDSETGTLRVVWSPSQDRVAVIGDGLPEPGDGRVYELWAIVDDTPIPAGLFDIDNGSIRDVADVADIEPVAWGITVEPAGGSEAPTTPILFYAET